MRWLSATLCLFALSTAHAKDEVNLNYGEHYVSAQAEGQLFMVSVKHNLTRYVFIQSHGGFFVPNNVFNSAPNLFGGVSLGGQVSHAPLYATFSNGAICLGADSKNNAWGFNFLTKASFGITDTKNSIGISAIHISNGGLKRPNHGNTWFGIELNINLK